ncbi:MAG TPA: acireductone synthase [Polyangiaceae bacterium]
MTARAVVVDVEGTTTDVRFVHDTLFGIARADLPSFVVAHAGEPEVEGAREAVAVALGVDPEEVTATALAETLRAWIDADRKDTELKALQGRIWREGYLAGRVRGHVYRDVRPALERWRAAGAKLAVFSSGSVEAQKLLFRHSTDGDLAVLFDAHFDTRTGKKDDPRAYAAIAAALGVAPVEVLFLSDAPREVEAATAAGMRARLVARGERRADAVSSFDEIDG